MIQFSLDDLKSAYSETGNVHKAAAMVGVSHSRAYRALKAAGVMRQRETFTHEMKEEIRKAYAAADGKAFDLAGLAASLGKRKAHVCRVAKEMGLTQPSREKSEAARVALEAGRDRSFAQRGHPRGFAGATHSAKARTIIGHKSRQAWAAEKATDVGRMAPEARQKLSNAASLRMALSTGENAYSRAKQGRRSDIGPMYFRSAWEANYARYLNFLMSRGEIDKWEYEPEVFWFEKIRRGVRSYKPDFRITEKGRSYFVEVKGWMDPKSKTKLDRMRRYHPLVEVRVVGKTEYSAIARAVARIIPEWEGAA